MKKSDALMRHTETRQALSRVIPVTKTEIKHIGQKRPGIRPAVVRPAAK